MGFEIFQAQKYSGNITRIAAVVLSWRREKRGKLVNIYKNSDVEAIEVEPGRKRRLIHTDHLMVVVWDFTGGPWENPDAPHSHPHEQVAYIVEGEILFFLSEEMQRLGTGDMVAIPANVPHSIQLVSSHVRLIDSFTPLRQEFL
jgi:quercetin dioxygenase-like cupin family protein